jgi:phosphoribosylformylglycinamidine synthase II
MGRARTPNAGSGFMEPRGSGNVSESSGGLTPREQEEIRRLLGRDPNAVEQALFAVLWSEHCSYKTSRPLLAKLPRTGRWVLAGAGEENAGAVGVEDGWALVFKVESHNHPSAVEPFQGAATGVGGIVRDILAMGARPIALLDSLRVGDMRGGGAEAKKNRRLLEGIVSGIAHYGNCLGVPTVGGELACESSYSGNPLVNVLCLGVAPTAKLVRSRASGPGNPVYYLGAPTGRDGLGGAAFASRALSGERSRDLPAVQVGDPFLGKLLIEACLELVWETDAVLAMQDMGAAGLACSAAEMAARGGVGMELILDRVPVRQAGLEAWEILLSESQERMLLVVQKGREPVVDAITSKWQLQAACVGTVLAEPVFRVWYQGKLWVSLSPKALTEGAPLREAPLGVRESARQGHPALQEFPEPRDYHSACLELVSLVDVCSKRWIFEQYDHMVRLGTVVPPGRDAAVLRVPLAEGKWGWIAVTCDGNGRYCKLDPREGAKAAVAEALRNLAVVGAVPLGITDNLNLGNPEDVQRYRELVEVVEGIAEACRFFEVPVTGGNVSLYNETSSGSILPTPVIGAVGRVLDPAHVPASGLGRPGDTVLLLGGWGDGLGGSLYAWELLGRKEGQLPRVNLELEKRLGDLLRTLISRGILRGAHDLSEGGLWAALVEGCLQAEPRVGARVSVPASAGPLHQALFNEAGARALIGVPLEHVQEAVEEASRCGVPCGVLGELLARPELILEDLLGRTHRWTLQELATAWEGTLPRLMEEGVP